jgi:hypothetical protein
MKTQNVTPSLGVGFEPKTIVSWYFNLFRYKCDLYYEGTSLKKTDGAQIILTDVVECF